MKLIHRFIVDETNSIAFLNGGIDLNEYRSGERRNLDYTIVEIDEDDPRWPSIKDIGDASELVRTEFSIEELSEARFVGFLSKSISGYPEPHVDDEYLHVTFDLTHNCDQCGVGRRQKAPYRMLKEIAWGIRSTFQLNWIWDDLFVKPATWAEVFKPFGITCLPVLSKSGKELESVVQVVIADSTDLEVPTHLPFQDCPKCRRRKYLPIDRGRWPRPLSEPGQIFKSNEYFGDGGEAYQDMFVSNALYERMTINKLNCNYWACQE